jgi:hypothetical protein
MGYLKVNPKGLIWLDLRRSYGLGHEYDIPCACTILLYLYSVFHDENRPDARDFSRERKAVHFPSKPYIYISIDPIRLCHDADS